MRLYRELKHRKVIAAFETVVTPPIATQLNWYFVAVQSGEKAVLETVRLYTVYSQQALPPSECSRLDSSSPAKRSIFGSYNSEKTDLIYGEATSLLIPYYQNIQNVLGGRENNDLYKVGVKDGIE